MTEELAFEQSQGMAAQFSFTNGGCRRLLFLWIACAISSLPVPVSPSMRTVESVGATIRI